ncbi:diguanylate cyclase domain-containing protein [Deinococcus sp. JMULE3]|uniref:two-component system response regulator n=1 Tax=Deinococcus sp. JMULE3 TaxID=2518341 RepID=UPI001577032B|nr:diguanylate cyclase [Deinococcus sp. JMULE3]NTX98954.1 GGDEF domain-containing response regulator [Deinococcus sp. JMULE3]
MSLSQVASARSGPAGGLNLLIVEDSPEDAWHYQQLLSRVDSGIRCHHVQVGDLGARMLRELQPDCVLLDFHLPDMTGQEFLEQFRPQVPVLVITGSAEHSEAAGVLAAGAQRLLHKADLSPEFLHAHVTESVREFALRRELQLERQRMQAIIESAGHGMLFIRAEWGRWLVESLNPAATRLLGASVGPLDVGGDLPDLLERTMQLGAAQRLTVRHAGRVLDLECAPGADGFTLTVRDVTGEQRRAHLEQARHEVLQRFVEARPLPDVLRGVQDLIAAALPGVTGRVLAGQMLLTWPHLSALGVSTATYPHVTGRGARATFVPGPSGSSGAGCWALPVVASDEEQELLGAVLVDCPGPDETIPAQLEDVLSLLTLLLMQSRDQARLQRQAWQDALTGLPNRSVFMEQLRRELSAAERSGSPLAVGVLDLDGFKRVNDTYGHAGGDELLVEVARRLRQTFRTSDLVARVGGDEFTLLLPDWTDPDGLERDLRRRLRLLTERPFRVGAEEVMVRCSLGVALAPTQARTVDDLLKLADRAMYLAKRAGGGVRLSVDSGAQA